MNENEWIKKADDDLRTAETMITIEEPPIWIICYHCQQVAEKYLKAYLVKNDLGFREVHNLVYLFKLCVGKDVDFKKIEEDLKLLNPYAVTTRYPFVETREYTIEEAKEAIAKAKKIKDFVKKKLSG